MAIESNTIHRMAVEIYGMFPGFVEARCNIEFERMSTHARMTIRNYKGQQLERYCINIKDLHEMVEALLADIPTPLGEEVSDGR